MILAGGFGTRLGEYTSEIPKPMVKIGNRPIIWHIMNHYSKYNYKDFYIALGYKGNVIKDYFYNYKILNSDFTVNLRNGSIISHENKSINWNVTLVDTGQNTMTGGRIKKMAEVIGPERFMITYGDGLSDVNLDDLLEFHKEHGKLATVTAVRPSARFGEMSIKNNQVSSFQEKPQLKDGWISGGFFIFEPEIFSMISGDNIMLEREPMEKLVQMGQLMAYEHSSFWQCMDTKRDLDYLQKLWDEGSPW